MGVEVLDHLVTSVPAAGDGLAPVLGSSYSFRPPFMKLEVQS